MHDILMICIDHLLSRITLQGSNKGCWSKRPNITRFKDVIPIKCSDVDRPETDLNVVTDIKGEGKLDNVLWLILKVESLAQFNFTLVLMSISTPDKKNPSTYNYQDKIFFIAS